MIGALIEIGTERAIVISKFPVGFKNDGGLSQEMKMIHYYEIFSMGSDNGKKRKAIDIDSFQEAVCEGNIKVLSNPRKS